MQLTELKRKSGNKKQGIDSLIMMENGSKYGGRKKNERQSKDCEKQIRNTLRNEENASERER